MRERKFSSAHTAVLAALIGVATWVAIVPSASAASVSARAELSETEITVGDSVTLVITTVATSNGDVRIDPPAIEGLVELHRGSSDSTSISWTGAGQAIRRERTVRIEYEAQKPGKITIPPIVARLGDEEAKTDAIVLTVKGTSSPPPDDSAEPAIAGEVSLPTPEERDLFVRLRLDKSKVFVGDQILVDLEIFAAGNFNLEEAKSPPVIDGFWREIVYQPQRFEPRAERIANKNYRVYRLWRIALFPLEAGSRVISGPQLTFTQQRSLFDAGVRLRRTAPSVKVEVMPLPSEGRPRGFDAAHVGRYAFSASVDTQTVEAQKGVVLTLVVSGRGNIAGVKIPEVSKMDGFRVFPATNKDQIARALDGVSGSKSAEILLFPTRSGRLTIPSLSLLVFDLERSEYRTLSTDAITVHVEGAIAPPGTEIHADIDALDERRDDKSATSAVFVPPRPLRFRSTLMNGRPRLFQTSLFYGLMSAPPILFVAALALRASVRRMRTETPKARRKRAYREARHQLELASKLSTTAAIAMISETLAVFFLATMGEDIRGITHSELKNRMQTRQMPEPLVEQVIVELERLDAMRFSAHATNAIQDPEIVTRAQALVGELHRWQEGSET